MNLFCVNRVRAAGKPPLQVLLAIVALVFLPACGARSGHAVVIAGSTSVQPYAEILEEAFAHIHGGEIDVQGGGSSAGITAAQSGTADIGMSSRTLKESEAGLWSVEICKDGLAVIVHPSNPVADLTLEQIRAVYAQDVINWSQLGGRDARIHIITREEGSGSRSAFEDLVMDGREISPKAIVQASNGAVRQLVSDDRNAIGFISLGLVEEGEKPVKALRLQGVAATRGNVINGTYALFRPFLFVAREEPQGLAMEFIEFVLSDEGRRILTAEGLVAEGGATVEPPTNTPEAPSMDAIALFERLEGYWSTPVGNTSGAYFFLDFKNENRKCYLYSGISSGEGRPIGELAGGTHINEGMATLDFWYPAITEEGRWPIRPEIIVTLWLDLTGLKGGTIRVKQENPYGDRDWLTYYSENYTQKRMEQWTTTHRGGLR